MQATTTHNKELTIETLIKELVRRGIDPKQAFELALSYLQSKITNN